MPRFEVSEGLAHGLRLVDHLIKELMLTAILDMGTSTDASLSSGTAQLTLSGEDLVFGTTDGDPALISGTLTDFRYTYQPGYWVEYSGMSLDLNTLADAARAEADGSDTAALENLLYPLDWTIVSNSQSDSFPRIHVSYDGNPIAYRGDNVVWLDLGHDTFDASDGDDIVRAGIGNDTVWGGRGHDVLLGQGGQDLLNGQAGHDSLSGGRGQDVLRGGRGNDVLDGGQDNDLLTGGAGRDVFLFTAPSAPERDVIRDFETGVDMIRLQTDSPVAYVDTAAGLDIIAGHLTIHLRGLDLTDLQTDSIEIIPLV